MNRVKLPQKWERQICSTKNRLITNTTKYHRVQRQRMEVGDESEAVQARKKIKTAKKRKKQSPIQSKRKYMRE